MEQTNAIRAGLGSIVSLESLQIFTAGDLELRVCGLPDIDLVFLKKHTHLLVGLAETDPHIKFFWRALESFSKEELRMFLKFACNQERLPATCPCQQGGQAHTPPYPMKIAPPDGGDRAGNCDTP